METQQATRQPESLREGLVYELSTWRLLLICLQGLHDLGGKEQESWWGARALPSPTRDRPLSYLWNSKEERLSGLAQAAICQI